MYSEFDSSGLLSVPCTGERETSAVFLRSEFDAAIVVHVGGDQMVPTGEFESDKDVAIVEIPENIRPNDAMLQAIKQIEAIQVGMNPKPGKDTLEYLKEAREGKMYDCSDSD